jgi:MerR family transcriptional regulator, mercuric resistance operon regulatory protein
MSVLFTIGKLAAEAGVNVETVRYYQRRGLVQEPSRPIGSVRRYGQPELARLQFIRRAQALGFTLEEIAELLQIRSMGACDATKELTELKLGTVRQKIDQLRHLERALEELVAGCSEAHLPGTCPALDILQRK